MQSLIERCPEVKLNGNNQYGTNTVVRNREVDLNREVSAKRGSSVFWFSETVCLTWTCRDYFGMPTSVTGAGSPSILQSYKVTFG